MKNKKFNTALVFKVCKIPYDMFSDGLNIEKFLKLSMSRDKLITKHYCILLCSESKFCFILCMDVEKAILSRNQLSM